MKNLTYLKISLITFLFLFLVSSMSAQILLGGRAGINVASFQWDKATIDDDGTTTSAVVLPHVSFVTLFQVSDFFGVQTELTFLQKGAKTNFHCEPCTVTDANNQQVQLKEGDVDRKYVSSYIELPILAKIKIGSDAVAFNAFTGPSFAYALSGRGAYSQTTTDAADKETSTSDEEKLKFGKDYSRFDAGIIVGLGVQIGAGPGFFTTDFRYNIGLTSVVANAKLNETIKNRAFQIGLGYIIPL